MSRRRFPEEFKIAAVQQVTERGYPVAEVASRLGISAHSLYQWLKRYDPMRAKPAESVDQQAEVRHLKVELKRVTEERDILKSRRILCQGVRVRYAFIRVRSMSRRGNCLRMPVDLASCAGSGWPVLGACSDVVHARTMCEKRQ